MMPGKIKPGVSDEAVIGHDWFPTFAAMADAELPGDRPSDGVDLSGLLFEAESLPERDLFWSRGRENSAIRAGKWKLIVEKGKLKLYDLEADLAETTNLADKHPERVKRLQQKLDAWSDEVRQGVTRRS